MAEYDPKAAGLCRALERQANALLEKADVAESDPEWAQLAQAAAACAAVGELVEIRAFLACICSLLSDSTAR